MDSLDTLVHARLGPDSDGPGTRWRRPGSPGVLFAEQNGVASSEPAVVLGRYRLLERLGAGGFGVVWRAHDELLHREVAVKRISLGAGGDPIDSERASREALAGARLAHPAIVVLHEACAAEDAFYLISELIHGDTLAELIAARALGDEELLEIGLALTDALAHAHARGVIHRDVKPQNVLVPHEPDERGGVAKLTDFGGARLTGEDALTRTGDVLGTLAYMAPEQSEGREAAEPADLYALALVLYEGLSGVNPVRGSTPAATARRIGSRLEPLERRRGDLPRSLTRAIDLALPLEPEQRGTRRGSALGARGGARGGLKRPRRRSRRARRGIGVASHEDLPSPEAQHRAADEPGRERPRADRRRTKHRPPRVPARAQREPAGGRVPTKRPASPRAAARGVAGVRARGDSSGGLRRAVPARRCCCLPPPHHWSCCHAARARLARGRACAGTGPGGPGRRLPRARGPTCAGRRACGACRARLLVADPRRAAAGSTPVAGRPGRYARASGLGGIAEQRRHACGWPQPGPRRAVRSGRLGAGRGAAAVGGARTQRRARPGGRDRLVLSVAARLRATLYGSFNVTSCP